MKTITLRSIPPHTAQRIAERAAKDGTTLSRTVINMVAESVAPVAPERKRAARPRIDLSKFAGTWTAEEADELDAYLKEMRRVDPEMWK